MIQLSLASTTFRLFYSVFCCCFCFVVSGFALSRLSKKSTTDDFSAGNQNSCIFLSFIVVQQVFIHCFSTIEVFAFFSCSVPSDGKLCRRFQTGFPLIIQETIRLTHQNKHSDNVISCIVTRNWVLADYVYAEKVMHPVLTVLICQLHTL